MHRWYRATVEHTYGYLKRFRILGERYRGKLNCKEDTGVAHLHNALAVIANLCAYHNRCEPHRGHPVVPQLESSSDESESEDEKANGMEIDTAPLVVRQPSETVARGDSDEEEKEEVKQQPCRRRKRRRGQLAVDVEEQADGDPHDSRSDYGQYEYQWQVEAGTGYSAEQFRRQQPVSGCGNTQRRAGLPLSLPTSDRTAV